MSRTIIQNNSRWDDATALTLVQKVVEGGRVSDSGKCYCYITVFSQPPAVVAAMRTKAGSDRFVIQNDPLNLTAL
jgi:hypothetical protein